MRAAGPLIVLLVVLSWTLPQHAGAQPPIPSVDQGAQTPIPSVDQVAREAVSVPPRTDPVDDLRDDVEDAADTASAIVERVVAPAPDVAVTSAPALAPQVVSTPEDTVADSSSQQSSGRRSGGATANTHERSPTGRHGDRAGTSSRLDRDTRQPDKRDDLYQVAAAGNEIHPTEVEGLTLTVSRQTILAVTGVYLLTWMAAGLFLIGLGALSLVSSRSRLARFSLRA